MSGGGANRIAEMETFVAVVEKGSFSEAGRASNRTPSAVSKLIARLESRLGVRLLNRSTRQLDTTVEGRSFYEGALHLLGEIELVERLASAGSKPSGRVRINSSVSYITHVLAPIVPRFLADFPDVSLDIVQTDAVIDILADRIDVAIRAGPMPDSSLVARKLGSTIFRLVASPSWVERNGAPTTISDISTADGIGFGYRRSVEDWPFIVSGDRTEVPAPDRIRMSDGEGIRRMALAGVGVARLAEFTVRDDIAQGRLVPILDDANPGDREHFHAVFAGRPDMLPARVRVFLDFLATEGLVR